MKILFNVKNVEEGFLGAFMSGEKIRGAINDDLVICLEVSSEMINVMMSFFQFYISS